MRIVDNYPIPGEHVVYNMDDERDVVALQRELATPTMREVLPRNWETTPLGAFTEGLTADSVLGNELSSLDQIVKPADLHDAIDEAHELKLFPYYYAEERGPFPDDEHVWDQDGLGYCWTWGFNAEYMVLRAVLGLPLIHFPPVANGYLVGWRNRGNYLESMIRGARENGLIPANGGEVSNPNWPDVDINSHNNSGGFWNQYNDLRSDFTLGASWDLNCRGGEMTTACQCVSSLRVSVPLYIAHNWWGHALGIECLFNDSAAPLGITYGHRNSHKNKRLLIMEGNRASPDEAIGLASVG